jgi:chromosome partitioning protein
MKVGKWVGVESRGVVLYAFRMRTLLIFSGKGGVGKTTLARELAVAGALAGRRVAIMDLDPQAGMTGWYARRAAETPIMIEPPSDHDLAPLKSSRIDELVVDFPPGVPPYTRRMITQATVVLVPCRPSPDDLSAAAGITDILEHASRWSFVLTQTLPRSRLTDGALRQLAALGRVAPVSLGLRQDYPLAAIDGQAAVEFSSTKSAEEIKQLRSYVDTLMEFRDGKKA